MKIFPIAGFIAVAGGLALATTGAFAQDSAKKLSVPLQKTIGTVTPTGPAAIGAAATRNAATIRFHLATELIDHRDERNCS